MDTTRQLLGLAVVTAIMLGGAIFITQQTEPQPITVEVPVEISSATLDPEPQPTTTTRPVARAVGTPSVPFRSDVIGAWYR